MMLNSYKQNYLTPEIDHPRSAFYRYQHPNQPLQTVYEHQPPNYLNHQFSATSTTNNTSMNNSTQPNIPDIAFEDFTFLESE